MSPDSVAKIFHRVLHGPAALPDIGGGRCVYFEGSTSDPGPFQVVLRPFPQSDGPRTLRQAKGDAVAMMRLGTAADRKTERIVNLPRLGTGAFAHAFLVTGVPGGPFEDVDAYTPKWEIFLNVPTRHLLAADELHELTEIAAAIGS